MWMSKCTLMSLVKKWKSEMVVVNATLFLLDPDVQSPSSSYHDIQVCPSSVGQGTELDVLSEDFYLLFW